MDCQSPWLLSYITSVKLILCGPVRGSCRNVRQPLISLLYLVFNQPYKGDLSWRDDKSTAMRAAHAYLLGTLMSKCPVETCGNIHMLIPGKWPAQSDPNGKSSRVAWRDVHWQVNIPNRNTEVSTPISNAPRVMFRSNRDDIAATGAWGQDMGSRKGTEKKGGIAFTQAV